MHTNVYAKAGVGTKQFSQHGFSNTRPAKQGNMSNISAPLRFVSGSSPTTWKDICFHGRKINAGCELEFIEPGKSADGKDVAKILKPVIDENICKWSDTLVGYVIGAKHFFINMKSVGCGNQLVIMTFTRGIKVFSSSNLELRSVIGLYMGGLGHLMEGLSS